MNKELDNEFFKGLQTLSNSSFPKKCSNCGKTYYTVDEYISDTESINQASGLKESLDDDDTPIVELFRNCKCGSTLMDIFNNRRDLSETGLKRREKFSELLERLNGAGVSMEVAREELLKVMRGEDSFILKIKKKSVAKKTDTKKTDDDNN